MWAILLLLLLYAPAVHALNIYNWQGFSGDVSDQNNWLRITDVLDDPPDPVPDSDDRAVITSGGGAITVTGNLSVTSAVVGQDVTMSGTVTAGLDVDAIGATFSNTVTAGSVGARDNTTFELAVVTNGGAQNGGVEFMANGFPTNPQILVNSAIFGAGSSLTTTSGALGFGGDSGLTFSGGATATVNRGTVPVNVGFTGADLPASTAVFMFRNTALNLSDSGTQFTANGDLVVGIGFVDSDLATVSIAGGAKLITNGKSIFGTFLPGDPNPPTNGKGMLTVDGSSSTWQAKGDIILGAASTADAASVATGEVTVMNGGTLDATGQKIILGQETGSEGTLNVRNASSTALSKDITIGSLGTGTLLVEDTAMLHNTGDAVLGEQAGGNGNATITGVGTEWKIDGNLTIGGASTGKVTVEQGGQLTVMGTDLIIGRDTNSTGTLIIDGPDAKVNGSANFIIGQNGDGTLQLLNGAQRESAGNTADALVLGLNAGSRGAVKVDGASGAVHSMFTITNSLVVGGAATGEVDITNGGRVSSTGTAIIARDQGSIGVVMLSGQDSQWNNVQSSDATQTGDITVGQGGTAIFNVNQGAKFSAMTVVLGQNAGSNGTVNLSGTPGAASQFDAVTLTVGDMGTGALIATGATKISTGFADVILGNQNGSQGTLTLDGMGTTWTVNGENLIVGKGGNGFFNVQNGAALNNTSLTIEAGQDSGSGQITVDGTNSSLHVSNINLGGILGGDGQLKILNGGNVSVDDAVRLGGASTGSILVSGTAASGGSPSTLTTKFLTLNGPSPGLPELSIVAGGQVFVTTQNSAETVFFGPDSGAVPALRVIGQGSQLTITRADTFIDGTALVDGGGALTVRDLNLGSSTGPQAKLTVGGDPTASSTVTITDVLRVGLSASSPGTLDIGAGGNVNLQDALAIAVKSGLVDVHDTGASLTIDTFATSFNMFGGALNITAGGTVDTTGSLDVASGGMVSVSNTGSQLRALDVSLGEFENQNSSLVVSDSGHVGIDLKLTVGPGSSVNTTAGGSIDVGPLLLDQAPSGQIRVGSGGALKDNGTVTGTVVTQLGGTVGGSGTINGKLINGGKVAPGDPQTLTVNGDYEQQSGGLLQIVIAGKTMPEFDHLNVTGHVMLDMGAKLELDFINGFAPKTGDKFDFLQSGDALITDNFSEVVITGLEPGFQFVLAPDGVGSYGLVALNDGVSTTVPEPSVISFVLFSALIAVAFSARRKFRAH